MALPSQGGFSSIRGRNMYRKKRKRGLLSWFVCIVVVGSIVWLVWPDGKSADTHLIDEIVQYPVSPPTTVSKETKVVTQAPKKIEVPVIEPITEPVPVPTIVKNSTPSKENNLILKPIPLATTISANLETGLTYLDNNQITEARRSLSQSLLKGNLTPSEEAQARGVLTDIADRLVFSPEISRDDSFAFEYVIRSGDTLSEIVKRMGVQVDWRFIQRINRISSATSIRPGQSLKLIMGPFHAVIDKASYRIDLFLGEGNNQVFVRSYPVGLGEYNSTPLGSFKVRRDSKLINPTWVNPRTRTFFTADNPDNPIGERWIGLEGIEERTKDLSGLGIHGTIEPNSIGTDSSMGCVRMHASDVAQVYEMLTEGVSTVVIHE